MAKRKKSDKKASSSAGSDTKLAHNPFAVLRTLSDQGPTTEAPGVPKPLAPKKLVPKKVVPKPTESKPVVPKKVAPEPIVFKPTESNPTPRFTKKLVVRMEKKGRRGKTVTRISGLPMGELKSLAVEMKKAMGCGAMVEGADLILQGSLVDRAVAWLDKQGAAKIVKGS